MHEKGVGKMRQAVFLDRDGTINATEVVKGKPYAPTRLEDFHYLSGAPDAISRFRADGYLVIVITNQPDLATGKILLETLDAIHGKLTDDLCVDDIFVCPHTNAAACACRKPKPGLLLQAAEKWDIDLGRSVMVGDRWGDVGAGRAAGCVTVHIGNGYAGDPLVTDADHAMASLGEASDFICQKLAVLGGSR
jgi:D-glycero-D-manno-heptose 1,7-bisphosphate phosphatase